MPDTLSSTPKVSEEEFEPLRTGITSLNELFPSGPTGSAGPDADGIQ